jgi:hypothetical protein
MYLIHYCRSRMLDPPGPEACDPTLDVPCVTRFRGNASRSPVALEFRSGACQESSVDGECVPGDPGSIAGRKKGDCSSDVLGFPDASQRIEVAVAIGAALLSIPVSGPDGGRRDSVHSDAIGSQTGRKG